MAMSARGTTADESKRRCQSRLSNATTAASPCSPSPYPWSRSTSPSRPNTARLPEVLALLRRPGYQVPPMVTSIEKMVKRQARIMNSEFEGQPPDFLKEPAARPATALGFEGAQAKAQKRTPCAPARPKSSGVAAGRPSRRRRDEESVTPTPGSQPERPKRLAISDRAASKVDIEAAIASREPCALAKSMWGLSTKGEPDQDVPNDAPIIAKPRRFAQNLVDSRSIESSCPPQTSFITEAPNTFDVMRLNSSYSLPRGYINKMWKLFKCYDDQDRGWLNRSDYQLFMRRVAMLHCKKISDASREIVRDIPEDVNAFTFNDFLEWSSRNLFLRDWLEAPEDRFARRLAEINDVSLMAVEEVRIAFNSFDIDGSGHIEFAEFKSLVTTLLKIKQDDLPKGRLQAFWRQLDEDGSGTIEFAEFLPWYLSFFMHSGGNGPAKNPAQEFYRSFRYLPAYVYENIDPKLNRELQRLKDQKRSKHAGGQQAPWMSPKVR